VRLRWFGPSRSQIWRRLAADIDGQYIPSTFWKRDRVEVTHADWLVVFDSYFDAAAKLDYTRIRAPYVNPDGFRFTAYRRGLFSAIAKRLGMQDVEVGHEAFDRAFILKSTSESRLRRLFANARIRRLLASQQNVHFSVRKVSKDLRPRFPDTADELCFEVRGTIKDLDRLKQLYDLFAVTLDELCRLGSAYQRAPRRAS
jgi:hypothetical protein